MRKVRWSNRAQRDLGHLDPGVRSRILEAVDRLVKTGHGDVKKLQATQPPTYRLRVGNWRVLYSLAAAETILALRVLPRGSAYR